MIENLKAIEKIAQIDPQRVAVIDDHRTVTFQQLDSRANQWVNLLSAHRVNSGDRIMYLLRNSAYFIEVTVALMKAGMVNTPLNVMFSPQDLASLYELSEAKLLITEEHFRPVLEKIHQVNPYLEINVVYVEEAEQKLHDLPEIVTEMTFDRQAGHHLLFSSGTTGHPKGILYSGPSVATQSSVTELEEVRHLILRPIFNRANYQSSLTLLQEGGTLVFLKELEPQRIYRCIEEHNVSLMVAPPSELTELAAWLEEATDRRVPPSLQQIMSTGTALSSALKTRLMNVMPHIQFIEVYGCTEAGLITMMDSDDWVFNLESSGRAVFFVDIAILDEEGRPVEAGVAGEVCVKTPYIMEGYYKDPELTKNAFHSDYYRTGDVGYLDEDEYLHVLGRKKDMINRGGMKFLAAEVERVIQEHPAVNEACVLGVVDDRWAQLPVAFVQLRQGAAEWDSVVVEIQALCQLKLASFKIPTQFIPVEAFPLNASGKIDRKQLIQGRDNLGCFSNELNAPWPFDKETEKEVECSASFSIV